ncbi:hypothetical protein SAMN05216518_103128 [Bacteroidales bacterium KHT7]|nr:hypothetical protein SAMN05216518_103128 [Bacteroidales bacterium KHT7]
MKTFFYIGMFLAIVVLIASCSTTHYCNCG